MLTEQLSQLVREAGGESLLLDARQGRALLGDSSRVLELCKQLRNIGFTRMIDFTAMHLGVEQVELVGRNVAAAAAPPERELTDRFQLWLTLRAPEHGHGALTLKWSWPPSVGAGLRPALGDHPRSADQGKGGAEPRPYEEDEPETEAVDVDPELARLGVAAHAIKPPGALEELSEGNGDALPHQPRGAEAKETNGDAETGYNGDGGAGQPGDPSQQAGSAAHPSLSHIWPAAGLCEREIWEMLGLIFTGHDNLAPLLLSDQFAQFPLRQGYEAPRREAYAARLLKKRHEQAMLDAIGPQSGVGAIPQGGTSPATEQGSDTQRADVGAGPRARPLSEEPPEDGPTRGSAPTDDNDDGHGDPSHQDSGGER